MNDRIILSFISSLGPDTHVIRTIRLSSFRDCFTAINLFTDRPFATTFTQREEAPDLIWIGFKDRRDVGQDLIWRLRWPHAFRRKLFLNCPEFRDADTGQSFNLELLSETCLALHGLYHFRISSVAEMQSIDLTNDSRVAEVGSKSFIDPTGQHTARHPRIDAKRTAYKGNHLFSPVNQGAGSRKQRCRQ